MNDYASKEWEEFFGAVGRLTISWAHIEAGIDFAVLGIYRYLGGDKIDRDLPRSLSRKLGFLKRAANEIPALAPYAERLNELRRQIETASEARHDIIHGFAISDLEGRVGQVAVRFLRESTEWTIKPVAHDTISVLGAAVDANRIASQSLPLGSEIAEFARTNATIRAASGENPSPLTSAASSMSQTAATTGSVSQDGRDSACPSNDELR